MLEYKVEGEIGLRSVNTGKNKLSYTERKKDIPSMFRVL